MCYTILSTIHGLTMSKHPLSPKFSKKQAGEKMGESPLWQNFALRIQHHPDIKQSLIILQQGKCPLCQMPVVHTDTVHHLSYLSKCITEEVISFPTPTQKRPSKTSKAPPCSGCPEQQRCLRLLALVHDRCHYKIHAND